MFAAVVMPCTQVPEPWFVSSSIKASRTSSSHSKSISIRISICVRLHSRKCPPISGHGTSKHSCKTFVGLSVFVILIELLKGGYCLILLSVPISFVYVAGYLICTSGLHCPLCGSLVSLCDSIDVFTSLSCWFCTLCGSFHWIALLAVAFILPVYLHLPVSLISLLSTLKSLLYTSRTRASRTAGWS